MNKIFDYTNLTFNELIEKISIARFFHLPKMVAEAFKKLPAPKYKVYTALLTQSGTDAPVATVLENTLGDIVWSYVGVGGYIGTLTGAFTENKTILPNTYAASTDGSITSTFDFFNLDENIVSIRTRNIMGDNQDDLINFNGEDFLFEIRVYN